MSSFDTETFFSAYFCVSGYHDTTCKSSHFLLKVYPLSQIHRQIGSCETANSTNS